MVQDLYQMAFFRQLESADAHPGGPESAPISDEALSELLYDYAAFLERTDYLDDAELLVSLADQTAAMAS